MRFDLQFLQSGWWLLPGILAAVALAWWHYRKPPRDLAPWLKWLLVGLRAASLFLILALLLEPVLTAIFSELRRPAVLVLQDDSRSIAGQPDSARYRNELPSQLNDMLSALEGADLEPTFYTLGRDLKESTPEALGFTGSSTNLADALNKAADYYRGQPVAGIVLLTDGIYTQGANPQFSSSNLRAPVYTVLLGDSTPRRDLRIENVLYNELTYRKRITPIRATLRATGYEQPINASLQLWHRGAKVDEQAVSLEPNQPQDVSFNVQLDSVGIQTYQLVLSQRADEEQRTNNRQTAYIRVLENRTKLFIVAGGPHPDLGALRQAFGNEEQYQLYSLTRKSPTEWYETYAPDSLSKYISEADVFILHNFPASAADGNLLSRVLAQAENRDAPLWHIVGQRTNVRLSDSLQQYMALRADAASLRATEAFAYADPSLQAHSTYTFEEGFEEWLRSGPPFRRMDGNWELAGGAQVLVRARIRGLELSYPVVALQDRNGKKNAVFLMENFWRYRMHNYQQQQSFAYFDGWLQNLVQWLATQQDKRRFRVYPAKRLFTGDDRIVLKGQVYDESFNPQSGAEVNVSVQDSSGSRQQYTLNEVQPGAYQLDLGQLPRGEYRFTAEGLVNNGRVGTDGGAFTVGESNLEFVDLQARPGVLRQLALRTEGAFYTYDQLSEVADAIAASERAKPVRSYNSRTRDLRRFLWPMLLLLALLTAEWVLRKRYGLL